MTGAARLPGARSAADDKPTRTAILDAAETIMREEGYAAVSSRKIAAGAGLKSQLVHYYFKTMDDLFAALLHRVEEQYFDRLVRAATSRAPLRAVWRLLIDIDGPRLTKEFVALATHREPLRREIARSAERTRSLLAASLSTSMDRDEIGAAGSSPVVLAVLMDAAARLIIADTALGTAAGHRETVAYIESQIERLEPQAGR